MYRSRSSWVFDPCKDARHGDRTLHGNTETHCAEGLAKTKRGPWDAEGSPRRPRSSRRELKAEHVTHHNTPQRRRRDLFFVSFVFFVVRARLAMSARHNATRARHRPRARKPLQGPVCRRQPRARHDSTRRQRPRLAPACIGGQVTPATGPGAARAVAPATCPHAANRSANTRQTQHMVSVPACPHPRDFPPVLVAPLRGVTRVSALRTRTI